MSSGFGLRGGIGRCYPFWAEYKECLVRSLRVIAVSVLVGTREGKSTVETVPSDLRDHHMSG